MQNTLRTDLDDVWENKIWPRIISLANSLEVQESDMIPPRRTERQTMRANIPGDASTYFKVCFYYTLLV